jgi:hypothetical protein
MATKGTKSGSVTAGITRPERAPFVGYVNTTLGEKDREDYVGWSEQTDVVSEGYFSALELGYQFTIKFDKVSDAYMCSVSMWDVARPDAGLIYTARSDRPDKALFKAVYVVSRKFAYNLGNGYVSRANPDAF